MKQITFVFVGGDSVSFTAKSHTLHENDYDVHDDSGVVARIPREHVLYVTTVDVRTMPWMAGFVSGSTSGGN